MARAGAPSQRGRVEKQGRDLRIFAPAAIWPQHNVGLKDASELTPEDIIKMQAAELLRIKQELELQKIAAQTITRFCICCMYVIEQHTGEDVVSIGRDLYKKLSGSEIQIAEWQDGNVGPVYGRYLEKSPDIRIGG
jgi:hypothetical protein